MHEQSTKRLCTCSTESFNFELCELICNSIVLQIEQQTQPLQEFAELSQDFNLS